MPTFNDVAAGLPKDQIDRMREALELGKWPDGQALTAEQRETTMAAVIAWETQHLSPEQRSGYLPPHPGRKKAASSRIPTVSKDDE